MPSPSDLLSIPLDVWIDSLVKDWLVPNFRPLFRALQWPMATVLNGLAAALAAIPVAVFTVGLAAAAWATAGRGVALFTLVSLALIDMIGLWSETMITLAMVLTAVIFCVIAGTPLGIAASRSDRFMAVIRPVLDIMQTIPSFVYLVPIVMLFGVGIVPGVIATIIFALPPIIRLTNLGIRNVRGDLIEAAYAFGATPWQVLSEVQLPLAMRTIMAGINQTLMLSLSMVVIAALIGAGGLGLTVYTGLGRLDVGAATVGGIGIVLLAIILDRITQALGEPRSRSGAPLKRVLRSLFRREPPQASEESGQPAVPTGRTARVSSDGKD